jgi:UDP-N-acetylmuramoylalanine-D-glutamate ligase
MSVYDFALKGKHNQYNTMAASVAGATMDIRKNKIREAVQTFENLEHRMERSYGKRRGVHQRQQSHQCELHLVCPGKHDQTNRAHSRRCGQRQRLFADPNW